MNLDSLRDAVRSPLRAFVLVFAAGLGGCATGGAAPVVISAADRLSGTALDAESYQRYFSVRERDELQSLLDRPAAQQELVLDYHSDRVLADYAESQGIGQDPLFIERLARTRRNMLIGGLVAQLKQNMEYPPVERLEQLAREQYLRYQDQFKTDERRTVAHILLMDHSGCPCELPSLAERVETVRKRLAEGADFAALAREFSDDKGTAINGGKLTEPVQRDGKTIPAFENAVFKIGSVGEVSEPFVTSFGTHFVKLLDVESAGLVPFEEVREGLIQKQKNDLLNSKLEKLRSDAYPQLESLDLPALNRILHELVERKSEGKPDDKTESESGGKPEDEPQDKTEGESGAPDTH